MEYNIPNDIYYSKTHEWFKFIVRDEHNIVRIGITHFASKALGDITYIEFNCKIGQLLDNNKDFAVIESVKSASDVYCALSGAIIAMNENLNNNPDIINKDPYGEGWIVEIVLDDNMDVEMTKKQLLSNIQYQENIA